MQRRSDSICLPSSQRRSSLDSLRSQSAPSTPAGFAIDMDHELPEAARLAHSKHFLMTENPNGKVLGCGEAVGFLPQESRFVVRIYNRDFNNNGKLKAYVEMTIDEFSEIHSHKSEIEKKINEARVRETIFMKDDLKVTVGPGYNNYLKPTVEIEKAHTKSSMYIDTFTKMMEYSLRVNEEHSFFNARKAEDTRILEEILNALAYVRNGNRPNGVIRQQNVGRRSGIFTTCARIVEQARSILPRDE